MGAYSNSDDMYESLVLASVINTLSKMNGAMLVLSFHVESSDVIRCYLSINGQIIRFMPSDIQNLLPAFFDTEFGDNAKWKESKEAAQLVGDMNKNLKDVHFNAFLKRYGRKSISKIGNDDEKKEE